MGELFVAIKKKSQLFDNIFTIKDINQPFSFISTGSRVLDSILGGGIADGRIVEIFGSESTGKSLVAAGCLKTAAENNRLCVLYDTEGVITNTDFLENVLNVDTSKILLRQESLTVEEILYEIEELCNLRKNPEMIAKMEKALNIDMNKIEGITVVWDSLAATPSSSEMDSGYEDAKVALQARALSSGFKKLVGQLLTNNVSVIIVNQTRINLNMRGFGTTLSTPGGNALKFYSSQRLRLTRLSTLKFTNSYGKEVIKGYYIKAEVVKNKISAPHKVGYIPILFEYGIQEEYEVYSHACELGLILKGKGRAPNTLKIKNNSIKFFWKDWSNIYNTHKQEILEAFENFYRPKKDIIKDLSGETDVFDHTEQIETETETDDADDTEVGSEE